MNTGDDPLEKWRPDDETQIDTSNHEPRTIPATPTQLDPTTEDLKTSSTDLHTPAASAQAPDPTGPGTLDQVVLHLADRRVAFTGTQVATIPSYDRTMTDERGWPVVYLTAKGNIAVHDPVGYTLTVHTMAEFITSLAGTPVSWIVDDVLAQLPRAVEQLDI